MDPEKPLQMEREKSGEVPTEPAAIPTPIVAPNEEAKTPNPATIERSLENSRMGSKKQHAAPVQPAVQGTGSMLESRGRSIRTEVGSTSGPTEGISDGHQVGKADIQLSAGQTPRPVQEQPDAAEIRVQIREELHKAEVTPARYVYTLDQQRKQAFYEMRGVQLYQSAVSKGEAVIPEAKHITERLADISGLSIPELVQHTEQTYQSLKLKTEVATEQLGFATKSFIEVPSRNVTGPARTVEVKTFEQASRDIYRKPVEQLDFKKDVTEVVRQSVVNEWSEKMKMNYSPEQFIGELNRNKQEAYSKLRVFHKAADQSFAEPKQATEFREQALRSKAEYIELCNRHTAAQQLFGVEKKSYRKKQSD
jgi:hypothetical protein